MPQVSGYLPWVGGTGDDDPYKTYPLQITLQQRSLNILNDLTCFNPETGGKRDLDDGAYFERQQQFMSILSRVVNVSSGILAELAGTDDEINAFLDSCLAAHRGAGGDFRTEKRPWYTWGSLEDFVAYARVESAMIRARFAEAYPDLEWDVDPVGAAFVILDELQHGSELDRQTWQHYREVFMPTLPTPNLPMPLILPDEPHGADLSLCQAFATLPDDLTLSMRRAELAYWLIVYTECDIAGVERGF